MLKVLALQRVLTLNSRKYFQIKLENSELRVEQ